MTNYRRLALVALAATAALSSVGCAPLAVGAVAGGVMVASDRRSAGIQLEDQAIELRVREAIDKAIPRERANISITSYNLRVLLTGEVTEAPLKAEAEAVARKSPNVRDVLNELHVGSLSTLANRNFDTALTSKVLAAMLQDKNVPSGTIKVVSERSVVYLMGRVTQAEGEAAARVASRVSGVQRVVKNFDHLSEAEAAALASKPAPAKQ